MGGAQQVVGVDRLTPGWAELLGAGYRSGLRGSTGRQLNSSLCPARDRPPDPGALAESKVGERDCRVQTPDSWFGFGSIGFSLSASIEAPMRRRSELLPSSAEVVGLINISGSRIEPAHGQLL